MSKLNRKIKIIYQILPYFIGGTERFLFNLIKYIDKKRFEPLVISHKQDRVISLFKSLNIQTKVINSNNGINNLANFLKKSKVNIAQSNHLYSPLAIAANLISIPHIWRTGGHISIARPDLNLKQREHLLNMMSILSQKIVCPSDFLKYQFKNIKNFKIKIIYSGVDFDKIDSIYPDYTLLTKYGCNDSYLAIGMVAYLVPWKRHIDFIYAARKVKKELPNAKFFIFGTPYPYKKSLDYAQYLYKTVKDIGMDKDIIFAGFCKDILKAIASMNLIVLPTVNEGASVAIIEAMALGRPVVASDSGGNPEFIKDKVTGLLVPPKNPKKLAEAMIEILRDSQKTKMMGERGRERARRLFDVKNIVHQYEELYQKVYRASIRS